MEDNETMPDICNRNGFMEYIKKIPTLRGKQAIIPIIILAAIIGLNLLVLSTIL